MSGFHFSRAVRGMLVGLFAGLACATLQAHPGDHDSPPGETTAQPVEIRHDARTYFTDTRLLTQDGQSVRFYSDVLANRVVLINVVFTHCGDACPLITRKLKEVRDRMGARFGKDVYFVSISIDPERDTPQALKKFARLQEVDGPGWIFLTGAGTDVSQVLARLGQMSPSIEQHSTLLIAGNVGAKRWSKIRPDAPVAAIVERLQLLAAPR